MSYSDADGGSGGGVSGLTSGRVIVGSAGGSVQDGTMSLAAGVLTATGSTAKLQNLAGTAIVDLNDASGSSVKYGNNNALLIDTAKALLTGRMAYLLVTTVASAATVTLGNTSFAKVTGTTNIDFFTKTGFTAAGTATVVYVHFAGALTINHNTGSPGASEAPILTRTGANFAVYAGQMLAFAYEPTSNTFCML